METLALALGTLVLYLIAYHTYGRWLARKIFKLDPQAQVPSVALNDDRDYVPTCKTVVFGHHFTSIAGTGPIVGPAVAVIWGWVPALLWVLFGSILIGAVHDFGSLVVSLRNRGQTVGQIAGRVLSRRSRVLFLGVLFLALTIVLAIFGLVIASVFQMFPAAIFPCLVQIPLAIVVGVYLHRRGVNLLLPSLAVLGLMYLSVAYGDVGLLGSFNRTMAGLDTMVWVLLLLLYSYAASVLPVWVLLQPRDYINSLQLLSALALIVIGLTVAAFVGGAPVAVEGSAVESRPDLEIVAPSFNPSPQGAPFLFPFLFITIACGAISGFHCLVSSGTSSKQLKNETDAQMVGYGSMLTEGFLATLVILACVAGLGLGVSEFVDGTETGGTLTGTAAFDSRYGDWAAADGFAAKINAFVNGSANFLQAMGVGAGFAVALMGVLVASFAATTLDTACRLQRYVTQELASTLAGSFGGRTPLKPLLAPFTSIHGATILAVAVALVVAAVPQPGNPWQWENLGRGGLNLWPLFGATNQLLAGLAFLVIAFWLWRRQTPVWFIVLPMIFMLFLPGIALLIQVFGANGWLAGGNYLLAAIGIATLLLEIWILIEASLAWPKAKGQLEEALPPLPTPPATGARGVGC